MNINEVIVSPLVTEKTETAKAALKEGNRYTMKVHPRANKELIRQALHKLYKVDAVKVNTMIVPGKKKRFRMSRIKLSSWKKAVVTLAPGQSIDFSKTA